MTSSNVHDASAQILGYEFQIRVALLKLLEEDDDNAKICVEKIDDIFACDSEGNQKLTQVKRNTRGNISDCSEDLWKTIKVWIDFAEFNSLEKTSFLIITTSKASEGSIAYNLKEGKFRNGNLALEQLIETAETSQSLKNKKSYESFLKLAPEKQKNLVNKIFIYDCSLDFEEIEIKIKKELRPAIMPDKMNKLYTKLLGWWNEEIKKCLLSEFPIFIAYNQLHHMIVDMSRECDSDSLPIDVDFLYNPSEEEINNICKDQIFIKQLRLIMVSNDSIKRAIRDYYNAYSQRSFWVREELIFINELERYERRLIDEWERLRIQMKEDMDPHAKENEKQDAGKKLYRDVENLGFPIRSRVTEPFIMRGTYHSLSNKLKVGWHVDFFDRLKYLLGGE